MWQRPILPAGHPASTFGAAKLNFCVRNENRWTFALSSPQWLYNLYLKYRIYTSFFQLNTDNCIEAFIIIFIFSVLSAFFCLSIFFLSTLFRIVFVYSFFRISIRPISIGQLNASQRLHTRPINPVVFRGS